MLTVARLRAEAEDLYGQKLADIENATNRISDGFQKDDGASVKKAYEGVRTNMSEAARNHRKIASNIRELVLNPFSRWADQHAARVQNSQDDLQSRIKAHDRQAETVRQYRSAYFNKCRRVEDLDEEEKLAFQDPTAAAVPGTSSPTAASLQSAPSIKVEEPEEEPEPVEIGDSMYQPDDVKKLLSHILNTVRLGEAKVPILGTYTNVTTGSEIVEYVQKHMNATTIAYAEKIGQDLMDNGFLRLVGNVGSTFANSSKMNYQWRPKVFQITGLPDKKPKLMMRTSTMSSQSSVTDSPIVGTNLSEYLGGWNPLNNAHPNETPGEKLRREAKEADDRYKAAVRKLDGLRCNLEEAMIEHFKFMERCELDRLKAIKSVILDFSGAISNVIPSLQSTVDNMMLFQETVQPLGDLRYLLENYRTGGFIPRVTTYENYYNTVDEQMFGVDIEARARSDRKRVPLVVTTILTFLDSHYPDLEGDEARRSIWLVDVPLAATHHLRNQINTGSVLPPQLLEKYEIPIVASVLKLYLLELPDSLVSSHLYEIVKTVYTSTGQTANDQARVQVIQSTLGQLRLANIATLDALTTHFTRLIELTSADDKYISDLASALAPCILRPKTVTGISMGERYNYRLVRDLFAHKDAIFGELKRQSSLTHTNSGASRQRAISTDESKRREHMEERQRAIAAAATNQASAGSAHRSRSPGPSQKADAGHRRDRSRGPETRFPVNATVAGGSVGSPATERRVMSPTSSSSRPGSLEVPNSPQTVIKQQTLREPISPPKQAQLHKPTRANGSLHQPPPAEEDELSKKGNEPTNQMSASLSGPADLDNFYAAAKSPTPIDTKAGVASKYKLSNPDLEGDSPVVASPAEMTNAKAGDGVVKRDSLNRTVAKVGRKGTGGGLSRQSLISKRDSVGSIDLAAAQNGDEANATAAAETAKPAGVQLEDKPMDFD
ncbi:hypothetical protein K431DRAFT_280801 [Polychaeton citri CBS 116435]|uniref:Rho-GTPase-activating protein 8 n=1 Tax=Polychaeton citri CBS 116435 TaxID=1314669 RepID=A0A9P4QID9_9PEZI|nr:hypothetical protein K431DRAFT_280801 [Polychaeton citri CBS 116435]